MSVSVTMKSMGDGLASTTQANGELELRATLSLGSAALEPGVINKHVHATSPSTPEMLSV